MENLLIGILLFVVFLVINSFKDNQLLSTPFYLIIRGILIRVRYAVLFKVVEETRKNLKTSYIRQKIPP